MIEGWQERGIPLHVVIRAIESVFDTFDKKPAQPRAIKSLFYCREEVESQFLEWSASQAGKSSSSEDDDGDKMSKNDIEGFIDKAVDNLRSSTDANLREDFDRAVSRLIALRSNLADDMGLVEQTLFDIEKFLDRALLANVHPEHLKGVKKDITAQLKSYKSGMEADAYQNTFDLMLLKRLREQARVPRLSLFHL